jgi:crossover junction endodeoxyribonuclease RuvC
VTAYVVIGLDLSLTATGVAIIHSAALPGASVFTLASTGRRDATLAERQKRLTGLAEDILTAVGRPDLVVVEGPAIMAKHGSNWDRAGLWWLVLSPIIEVGIPVAVAAPMTVKKFAAGKGNADKATVAVGVARLWPDVHANNDNEWDALTLATMGAQHIGLDVPTRAHHAETLTKVAWPKENP